MLASMHMLAGMHTLASMHTLAGWHAHASWLTPQVGGRHACDSGPHVPATLFLQHCSCNCPGALRTTRACNTATVQEHSGPHVPATSVQELGLELAGHPEDGQTKSWLAGSRAEGYQTSILAGRHMLLQSRPTWSISVCKSLAPDSVHMRHIGSSLGMHAHHRV